MLLTHLSLINRHNSNPSFQSIKDELNKIYILKQQGVLKQYLQKKLNGKQIIVNASIDVNPEEIGGG